MSTVIHEWTKALEMVFNSSDLSTATYIRDFLKKKNKKNLVPTVPNFFQAVPLNTDFFFFGLIMPLSTTSTFSYLDLKEKGWIFGAR